jgi:hypothetical protein
VKKSEFDAKVASGQLVDEGVKTLHPGTDEYKVYKASMAYLDFLEGPHDDVRKAFVEVVQGLGYKNVAREIGS